MREFFAKESDHFDTQMASQKWPEMEDMANFKESAIYKDEFGQALLNENTYSSALYMRIFAHEVFSNFKETIQNHFDNDSKSSRWVLRFDFQKNAVTIWEKISGFKGLHWASQIQEWVYNIVNAAAQMIAIYMVGALLVGLCLKSHLREQTVESMPWIFSLLVLCGLVIFLYWWYRKERTQEFDDVRDLI